MATTWEDLDDCLEDVAQRIDAASYLLSDAGQAQLSPCARHEAPRGAAFKAVYQQLAARFGASFLRHGSGERVLFQDNGESFVAEVLLRSYLLVFLFDNRPNFFQIRQELDHAVPLIEALIERLPPLSGGGREAGRGSPVIS